MDEGRGGGRRHRQRGRRGRRRGRRGGRGGRGRTREEHEDDEDDEEDDDEDEDEDDDDDDDESEEGKDDEGGDGGEDNGEDDDEDGDDGEDGEDEHLAELRVPQALELGPLRRASCCCRAGRGRLRTNPAQGHGHIGWRTVRVHCMGYRAARHSEVEAPVCFEKAKGTGDVEGGSTEGRERQTETATSQCGPAHLRRRQLRQ